MDDFIPTRKMGYWWHTEGMACWLEFHAHLSRFPCHIQNTPRARRDQSLAALIKTTHWNDRCISRKAKEYEHSMTKAHLDQQRVKRTRTEGDSNMIIETRIINVVNSAQLAGGCGLRGYMDLGVCGLRRQGQVSSTNA